MTAREFYRNTQRVLTDNSPLILTSAGVVGVVSTAVLTGKASIKAVDLVRTEQAELVDLGNPHILTPKDKVALTWRIYLPAVATGTFSVICIIGANHVGSRRTAAVAAAYSLSDKAFTEYRAKSLEILGEDKEREIRETVAIDKVNNLPPAARDVVISGNDVLCMDSYSGRTFKSNMQDIKDAQNWINYTVNNNFYASLTDFYNRLGIPRLPQSDDIGWNSDKLLELQFHAVISEDNVPVLVMDYITQPVTGYSRVY